MCDPRVYCRRWIWLWLLVPGGFIYTACKSDPLDTILRQNTSLWEIAHDKAHEVQIIYVQIERDKNSRPQFTSFTFGLDSLRYFYPASTVKLPVALLALERLHDLALEDLTSDTRMRIDSARPPQTGMLVDSTSPDGLPTIGNFVRQVFLVSNNNAFNRLFEFLGQDHIHEELKKKGAKSTRITHRLSAPEYHPEDNRYANPVSFVQNDTLVYALPERYANTSGHVSGVHGVFKGAGYINRNGELVQEPFDFSIRNFYPLQEQVRMLKAAVFAQDLPEHDAFCLRPDDDVFLYDAMSQLPRESSFPQYDTAEYHDGFAKFLMYGDNRERVPEHIRIFNKAGWAYGYLTDCAYLIDIENNIEFILAATIHVNRNGIYNDGLYEYQETGIPFLAELGRVIYAHELKRNRRHAPDFSRFSMLFGKE